MRLSVIIPVYNAHGFLDRSLGAPQQSTFTDHECIIATHHTAAPAPSV